MHMYCVLSLLFMCIHANRIRVIITTGTISNPDAIVNNSMLSMHQQDFCRSCVHDRCAGAPVLGAVAGTYQLAQHDRQHDQCATCLEDIADGPLNYEHESNAQ